MIGWDAFIYFAVPALGCWLASGTAALKGCRRTAIWAGTTGCIVFAAFITGLWITLGRPPMRTMGETRRWYSLFTLLSGLATYRQRGYNWILFFSTVVAGVFVLINLLRPEIHDQTLMPALQSIWFIPHVSVYMFSYSVMGCAFLLALRGMCKPREEYLTAADSMVYTGMAFLTFGMISGAIWAKQAWGHHWNWDPKETWAAITYLLYLLYIHLRIYDKKRRSKRFFYGLLILAFAALQMCWWGVNYLPSAKEGSLHTYTMQQ